MQEHGAPHRDSGIEEQPEGPLRSGGRPAGEVGIPSALDDGSINVGWAPGVNGVAHGDGVDQGGKVASGQ